MAAAHFVAGGYALVRRGQAEEGDIAPVACGRDAKIKKDFCCQQEDTAGPCEPAF